MWNVAVFRISVLGCSPQGRVAISNEELTTLKKELVASRGWYNPRRHYDNEAETRAALNLIFSGHFNPTEPGILWDSHAWKHMAILNVAGLGKFSSDRAIAEYAAKCGRQSRIPYRKESAFDNSPRE